ncbi:MAG: hypothetical protein ACRDKT_05460 [Actinomycetota bacterium]
MNDRAMDDAALIIEHARREADQIKALAAEEIEQLKATAVAEVQAVNRSLAELQQKAQGQMKAIDDEITRRRVMIDQHAVTVDQAEAARAELADLQRGIAELRQEATRLQSEREAAAREQREAMASLEKMRAEVEAEATAVLGAREEGQALIEEARRRAVGILADAEAEAKTAKDKAMAELDDLNEIVLAQRRKHAEEKASLSRSLDEHRQNIEEEIARLNEQRAEAEATTSGSSNSD